MKTLIKILILILCVLAAIGGVMIYAKTKVEPPMKLKTTNQYLDDLENCYAGLMNAESQKKEDLQYLKTVDRIDVFKKEDKISSDEADDAYDEVLEDYTPKFMARCFNNFNQSVWNDADHEYILAVTNRLYDVRHEDNTVALSRTKQDSLNIIRKVIEDYRTCKKVCKARSFYGVDNARRTIHQAENFIKDPYLSHCTSLRDEVKNLKSNIQASHYRQVYNQVEKLKDYEYYSEDYFKNDLTRSVYNSIGDYEDCCKSLYGSQQNVQALKNQASNYYTQAREYYEQ